MGTFSSVDSFTGFTIYVDLYLICLRFNVKVKKEKNELTGGDNEKDIVAEAERLDIKDKAPIVLTELLFDNGMLNQITKYRKLFLRVCGIIV